MRTAPLRAIFQREKVLGHVDEPMLSVFRDQGVIPKDEATNFNKTAEDRSIYQLVEPGWLVVNRMKAWQGSVGVSSYRGIVSGHYICFRPTHSEHDRYLNWLFRSDAMTARFGAISRGVRPGQIEIDNDDLASTMIALPPIHEQRRIADFLDDQVALIETIVSAREEQGALVGVGMQRAIDDAFSPSGNHGLVRAARLLRVLPGFAFASDSYSEDDKDCRLLRGINVGVGACKWDEVVYWPSDRIPEVSRFLLASGDLVLGMDRPWIGDGLRIARIADDDAPCLLLQRVAKLECREHVDPEFIMWAYRASAFRESVEADLTGLSVPHLSGDQILDYRIPATSLAAQRSVAQRLTAMDSQAAAMAARLAQSVDLLKEYKRSLITAAVTGELDVTTARPRVSA